WCCVSHWTASGLTVYSNSYEADQLRLFLTDMLGLSQKQVRCISPYVGGSFGRGDTGEQPFFLVTALLSKRTGRPVKFRHTRRESFQNGRTIVHGDVRIGARKDGTILGIDLRETADVGAYLDHALAPVKFVPIEAIETQCHHIPSVKLETYAAYTNKMSGSCMRAIGNIQFNFLLGLGIDVLAEKLSIDPIMLVVKNFGDHLPLPNESIDGLLKEGAQRIGWKQKRAAADKDRSSSSVKKRGVGFSFHNEWHVLWQERRRGPITVGIKVNPDGTVVLDAPTIETGPGTNSVAVHICSEVLGVSVEQITWISTVDTLTSPKDQVQTDSAVSIIFAEAVSVVAKEARARLLALAAPLLGSDPGQLTIEGGVIYCPHAPKRQKTIQEVLEAGDMVPLVTVRDYDIPLDDRGTPFRATFAEVEVDTATGELQIIKLVVLDDIGT
ncbi:MAG: molybdopterin-dependent oxidoreductase, partial [Spirochaetaceae bacterium]|nr:molybdopterin-dependent oxidoreductase [Spirochaetaceae bacterium]